MAETDDQDVLCKLIRNRIIKCHQEDPSFSEVIFRNPVTNEVITIPIKDINDLTEEGPD